MHTKSEILARSRSPQRNAYGLGTANFVPFHTIKMYIEYAHKLNSVENLAGNILVFVPFGFLFPPGYRGQKGT